MERGILRKFLAKTPDGCYNGEKKAETNLFYLYNERSGCYEARNPMVLQTLYASAV